MATYTVLAGETISDVVLNMSGNILNWDLVLSFNNYTTWVPLFQGGEVLQVPPTLVTDANNLRALNQFPATNNSYDIYPQIDTLFAGLPG